MLSIAGWRLRVRSSATATTASPQWFPWCAGALTPQRGRRIFPGTHSLNGDSLNDIRIQNLRSLVDTGSISLKPLTLLVGANSSGKSTFLRFFPLLRQSVETPTDAPLLWFGRYVDFGSLEEATN